MAVRRKSIGIAPLQRPFGVESAKPQIVAFQLALQPFELPGKAFFQPGRGRVQPSPDLLKPQRLRRLLQPRIQHTGLRVAGHSGFQKTQPRISPFQLLLQREIQPAGKGAEPLLKPGKAAFRRKPRQSPAKRVQPLIGLGKAPLGGFQQVRFQIVHELRIPLAFRPEKLRGVAWRRGTQVRDHIGDGCVDFVADARHYRDA